MINWGPYLSGEISVWCNTLDESRRFRELAKGDGIPVVDIERRGTCYLISYKRRKDGCPRCSAIKNKAVELGYTQKEVCFHEFVGFSDVNPVFDERAFSDMLSW